MKFFSLVSALFVTLVWVASAQACVVNLQCGQALQLEWSSQGIVEDCRVTSPSGEYVGNSCSSPWIPVNAESGQYRFRAINSATGLQIPAATCQINMPTNCGGDFSVSASPNPVQVCTPATQGPTTVSWTIPSGKTGGIRLSNNPNWFVPAGTSISGSQSAPWITNSGSPFVFTLFETTGGTQTERGSVSVSATTAGCGPGNGGAVCGNNQVESPEQCDAGQQNGQQGSGCTAQCTLVNTGGTGFCGDSQVQNPNASQHTEQCDLGSANGQPGSACSATCQNVTGGGVSFNKCINNNTPSAQCLAAGTYQTFAECQAANGNTCVTSCLSCVTSSPNPTLYRCNGGTCTPYDWYLDIQTCNAALMGQCYYYSDCNNQCSQSSTYTITATPVNICTPNTTGATTIAWNNPEGQNVDIYRGSTPILQNAPSSGTRSESISGPTTFSVRPAGQTTGGASTTVTPTQNNCSPNNAINIGWDPSYQTKNKTVNIPPSVNETLYVNTGGEKGCSISGSLSVNPVSYSSYAVNNVPAGSYTYTLSCPNVSEAVSATLTVTPAGAGPVVTCTPSSASVPATFNWNASGFSTEPSCSISGTPSVSQPALGVTSGSFTVSSVSAPTTYTITCSDKSQSASVSCVAQPGSAPATHACINGVCSTACGGSNQPACTANSCQAACGGGTCGDGICSVGECSTCLSDCGNSSVCTDDATCTNVSVSPNPVVIGRDASFTISTQAQNLGNSIWTNMYKLRNIGGNLTTSVNVLGLSNSPVYPGQFQSFSIVVTTPSAPGSYSTQWQLEDNAGNRFGAMCPSATLTIPVTRAACVDGINNDGATDGLDCADPQCNVNGVLGQCCNGTGGRPLWNSETDQCGTTTSHTLTANPQLVRQGGASDLRWTTGGATGCYLSGPKTPDVFGSYDIDVDGNGTMDGWNITGDGTARVSGIDSKLTYQLFCSTVPRSATISVIKINEI